MPYETEITIDYYPTRRRLSECTAGNFTLDDEDQELTNSDLLVNSLRLYGTFFICLFPIYCVVRKKFKRTYAVRQWVEEIKSPLAVDQFGYFSWVWKVYSFSTEELVENVGLDAVCFLRLMKMGLRMAITGCLNSVWLFPTYLTAPQANKGADHLDRVSINILSDGSNRFFAVVLASYIFFGYAFYTILREFEWFIEQRHLWLRKFNHRNFTIYIRNIPVAFRNSLVLKEHFQLLYGEDTVLEANLLVHTTSLEAAVAKREKTVFKLEHALAELAITGKRPTHLAVKGMDVVDSIVHYTAILNELNADISERINRIERKSRPKLKSTGGTRRLMMDISSHSSSVASSIAENHVEDEEQTLLHNVGSREVELALPSRADFAEGSHKNSIMKDITKETVHGSKKVAIAVKRRASKLSKRRAQQARTFFEIAENVTESVFGTGEEGLPDDAAFVTFRSLVAVHAALQMSQHPDPFIFEVSAAPDDPEHVFWSNVGKDKEAVHWGRLISAAATVALCLFWTVPVATISNLTNVQSLAEHFPKLADTLCETPWLVSLLGLASPLILLLFNTGILPIVLKLVSRLEFPPSDSLLEASAFWKMAAFQILQTFFVSLISGSYVEQLQKILDNSEDFVKFLAEALPEQSAFFMQLLIVSTCVGTMIELFRVVPLIYAISRHFIGPRLTEEERKRKMGILKPLCVVDKFYFSRTQARFLIYYMVMFVYSSISPVVNYFSVIFFLLLGSVYRQQFIFNYPATPDSGGEIWLYFVKALLVAIVIAQLSLLGFLTLKDAGAASATMLPLIIVTALFILYLHQRHFTIGQHLPARTCLRQDLENDENEADYDDFENAYKNPVFLTKVVEPNWDAGKHEAEISQREENDDSNKPESGENDESHKPESAENDEERPKESEQVLPGEVSKVQALNRRDGLLTEEYSSISGLEIG